jgi:hypothetical protein
MADEPGEMELQKAAREYEVSLAAALARQGEIRQTPETSYGTP